jgi:hypothetical protein
MSFESLLIHSVTVTNPTASGSTDRYGNLLATTTSVVEKMRVQPGSENTEEIIDRDTRLTRFRIFARSDSTVTGLSQLTWLGRTLRVTGEPEPFYGRDTLHHLELNAEEVLG